MKEITCREKKKKGEKKDAIGVSPSLMGTIYALLSLTNPLLLAECSRKQVALSWGEQQKCSARCFVLSVSVHLQKEWHAGCSFSWMGVKSLKVREPLNQWCTRQLPLWCRHSFLPEQAQQSQGSKLSSSDPHHFSPDLGDLQTFIQESSRSETDSSRRWGLSSYHPAA